MITIFDYVYVDIGMGIVLSVDSVSMEEHVLYQDYLISMGEKGYQLVSARKTGFSGHKLTLTRNRRPPNLRWSYQFVNVDRGVLEVDGKVIQGMIWERYLNHAGRSGWILAAELASNRISLFRPILKKSEVAE